MNGLRWIKHVAVCLLLILLTACADGLFYHPNNRRYVNPKTMGVPFEDVFFVSRDGTRLHGWFLPATSPAWGTVIHYHGNAANITAHVKMALSFPENGLNVLEFDYRGYGESDGRSERKGVFEDSMAALDYVRSRPDVDGTRLLLLGQSLGGANAIAVAATARDKGIRAVVVDSSFYSYRSIARDKIGEIPIISWFRWPLSYIMATDSYNSGKMIRDIAPVPVMIIHGTKDRIVPYDHGLRLYASANEPKVMVTVPDGDHISALDSGKDVYRKIVIDFFRQSLEGGSVVLH